MTIRPTGLYVRSRLLLQNSQQFGHKYDRNSVGNTYVTGTAISDARIISQTDDGGVVLRFKDYTAGRARKTLALSGPEFVRRFALHILPPRFQRVRYGGFLGATQRVEALRLARIALGVPQLEESTPAESSVASAPAECSLRIDMPESSLPTDEGQAPVEDVFETLPAADTPGGDDDGQSAHSAEETSADDPDADCVMRCPNCGERKLRWVGTITARQGWAAGRRVMPRRVRQRMEREFHAHHGHVPAAPRAPPVKGGWSCDAFAS